MCCQSADIDQGKLFKNARECGKRMQKWNVSTHLFLRLCFWTISLFPLLLCFFYFIYSCLCASPRMEFYPIPFYRVYQKFRQALVVKLLDFRLEAIFATTPVTSKITTHFKSGQKWHKNIHLAFLLRLSLNTWYTRYRSMLENLERHSLSSIHFKCKDVLLDHR